MVYTVSVASLQQGRKNLRAVLEIMDLLWLNESPDIEDVQVPAAKNRRATGSRALASRVVEQVQPLLGTISDKRAASSLWVMGNQQMVREDLKKYENVYSKTRALYTVSSQLGRVEEKLGADLCSRSSALRRQSPRAGSPLRHPCRGTTLGSRDYPKGLSGAAQQGERSRLIKRPLSRARRLTYSSALSLKTAAQHFCKGMVRQPAEECLAWSSRLRPCSSKQHRVERCRGRPFSQSLREPQS